MPVWELWVREHPELLNRNGRRIKRPQDYKRKKKR